MTAFARLSPRDQRFSEVERPVLRFADAETATPVEVRFRARMYHALGFESDNLYCVLPPGHPAMTEAPDTRETR